jgi:hypothetical protein
VRVTGRVRATLSSPCPIGTLHIVTLSKREGNEAARRANKWTEEKRIRCGAATAVQPAPPHRHSRSTAPNLALQITQGPARLPRRAAANPLPACSPPPRLAAALPFPAVTLP